MQVEELPEEVPREAYQYALPTQEERAALAALLPDARAGSAQKSEPEPEPEPATVAPAVGDAAPVPKNGNGRVLSRTREGLDALESPTKLRRTLLKHSNGHASTAAAANAHQDTGAACDQRHGVAAGPHSAPLGNGHARAHGAAGAQEAAGAALATRNEDGLGGGDIASSNGHDVGERVAAERQDAAKALPPKPPADQPMPGRGLSAAGEHLAFLSQQHVSRTGIGDRIRA